MSDAKLRVIGEDTACEMLSIIEEAWHDIHAKLDLLVAWSDDPHLAGKFSRHIENDYATALRDAETCMTQALREIEK